MFTTIVVTGIQLLPPKSNSAIYDTEKVVGDLWSEVRSHSENKWKHCTGQSAPWHW